MFSQPSFCPHGDVSQHAPGQGLVWIPARTWTGMCGPGVCGQGSAHPTRTPHPCDGHCSAWYASYWNALLFLQHSMRQKVESGKEGKGGSLVIVHLQKLLIIQGDYLDPIRNFCKTQLFASSSM